MTADPGSGTPMSDRMQALLSRAVEDQLSEQRQVAGVLSEVRGQLSRLGGELEQLRVAAGEAGAGPGVEAGLSGVAADVREGVRLLAERVDGVSRLVQQRGADLSEIRAALAELHEATQRSTDALGSVNGGLSALPSFGDRIGALQDTLSGVHGRLEGFEELHGGVDRLQQRSDALDHGLRELRSAFAGIAGRVAELPGRADLEAAAGRTVEPVAALGGRLDRLEQALAEALGRLDGIAGAMDRHAEGIDALHERIEQATQDEPTDEDDHDPVGPRLEAVEEALRGLTRRMDIPPPPPPPVGAELAEQLGELQDGLFGEGGLADQVDALSAEDPSAIEARIALAVSAAVAESERRLSSHIDDAVLALAEALLRRRTPRVTPGRAAATPPAAAPAAVPSYLPPAAASTGSELDPLDPATAFTELEPQPRFDEAPAADDLAGDGTELDGTALDDTGLDDPGLDDPGIEDAEGYDDAEGFDDEVVAGDDEGEDGPAWQTPIGAPTAADASVDDAHRRRRPWWRPGE